jgi:CDP-diacylglycerol--serine O-phosphatidyltransferase
MNAMVSPLDVVHPSNLLTYASLTAGLAAIAVALEGTTPAAGALVAIAVLFDTFDGRFARLFRRSELQAKAGGQLDSLADAIAFGVAPVVCAWLTSGPAFVSSLLYAACAITRLAFYNVTEERRDGFVGLPVPVAALIWTTSLALPIAAGGTSVVFAAAAVAMVLPLPIPRPRGFALLAFACWPAIVGAAHVLSIL